jgi:hypothetical protein
VVTLDEHYKARGAALLCRFLESRCPDVAEGCVSGVVACLAKRRRESVNRLNIPTLLLRHAIPVATLNVWICIWLGPRC